MSISITLFMKKTAIAPSDESSRGKKKQVMTHEFTGSPIIGNIQVESAQVHMLRILSLAAHKTNSWENR